MNKVSKSLGRYIAKSIFFNSSLAIVVPLLNWAFHPFINPHYLVINYLYALVYSNIIGGILMAVVPPVWIRSDRFPPAIRWPLRIAVILTGAVIGCLIADLILLLILRGDYNFGAEFLGSIKIALVLSAAAVAITASLDTYRYRLQATAMDLKRKELERERAVSLMTQMRLSSLESRVHPHFLFNTINSISSLIHEDPQRAEDMLTRMAALLRFSLESSQPGLVPAERELNIVRDYLEIETARFAERLRYEIDCEDEGSWLRSVLVPPLSIQTLVENSIKYAVNSRKEGAFIRIVLRRGPGNCLVEVQDDGPGFASLTLVPGHGLDNLEERLAMLFGDSSRLMIRSTAKQTTVAFTVPCEPVVRSGVRSEHESAARVSRG